MSELCGTVTFLFTDIEGSTRLWEEAPEAMRSALVQHDDLLRAAIESFDGHVFKTVGDAFCAAFDDPCRAVEAVLACQQWLPALALETEGQRDGETEGMGTTAPSLRRSIPLKVRMALHTGPAEARDGDYFGPALNRLARLLAAAHGGQILVSGATAGLLDAGLPAGATLLDRGSHRLKDLQEAEHVFQLCHPELDAEFPPLRSLSAHPNNLPQQLTSFIGREREMATVRRLLGSTRLLTLTGTGGTGKTRLSLQVAAELLESYPDGVWLVELAALANPSLVPQSAANVLGVEQEPGKSLTQSLVDHLQTRHLLLVLDNCEHVLTPVAHLAEAILRACPHVRILATSREALRISGETAHRVPSLSLPEGPHDVTPERLLEYESTRLFIERAGHAGSGFTVNTANAPALLSICRRLDGIPLAIELAAARARSLSIEDVNRRLDQRFRLLTGGSRTALPRQQTLRSLIDWSYDLLTEQEKAVLERLSVFAGGWTLDAAEVVCAGEGIEDWEVVDLLTSLSDKSLVVAEERAGSTRYRLLETVRQYATEKAAQSGAGTSSRNRHLAHFLALAEEAMPHLSGAQQALWLDRLESEHDNLRAALVWSREQGDGAECGFRLAAAVWRFWMMRGYLSEGRQECSLLFEAYPESPATRGLGAALHAAANLALIQSDRACARELYEKAIGIRREVGDAAGEAGSLGNLATLAQQEGDIEGARRQFEAAVALFEKLGDENGLAISFTCLGTVAQAQGDHASALEFIQRALAANRRLGNRAAEANALNNLGCVVRQAGDAAAAQKAFRQALAINRELGFGWEAALNLINLGSYSRSTGNLELARTQFVEALECLQRVGARNIMVECLYHWAHLDHAAGLHARSARLFGAVHAWRETLDVKASDADAVETDAALASLRSTLGEDAYQRELGAGQGLTIDEAIGMALGKPAP